MKWLITASCFIAGYAATKAFKVLVILAITGAIG